MGASFRILDAYCCQGGAGEGYRLAGFDVTGVDIDPQPRNPHLFIQSDAINYIRKHGHEFDAIHCSPPCQHDSACQRIQGRDHADLIEPTRDALLELGKPYVIENVGGARAKLRSPVELCGSMFGLETYRHRYFETSWPLIAPFHPPHVARQTKMGRPVQPGEFGQFVGNFSGVDLARRVMDMPWANRDGLREAIPPSYTKYIGDHLAIMLMKKESA